MKRQAKEKAVATKSNVINNEEGKETTMSNSVQTQESNKKQLLRMREVTSRMVGMYRLIDEQVGKPQAITTLNKPPLKTKSSTFRAWSKFRGIVMDVLEEMLLNEKDMRKLITKSRKAKQGVGDLMSTGVTSYPEQAIKIRMGFIMQEAVKRFVLAHAEALPTEVWEAFKQYADKGIQWDLAFKKDDTVFVIETKYNLNLDTEKVEKVVEKLDLFSIFLKKYYKNQDVKTVVSLASLYYPSSSSIPEKELKPALLSIKDAYIMGYSELFELFGLKITDSMWRTFHTNVVDREIRKTYKQAVDKYFK